MIVGMTGVKGLSHGLAHHDFGCRAEGNLLLIQDEGVRENFSHAFELVMGGDDEVPAFGEVDEAVGKMAAAFDIESVEGFIEQENMSFLGEGAGDVSALLLSAGELINLAVRDVAEFHSGNRFFGFLRIYFSETLQMSEVWKASHRDNIANANWKVALMLINLREIGNFTTGLGEGCFAAVDGAVLMFEQAGEKADESAFSCSIGTEKSKSLSAMNREIDLS